MKIETVKKVGNKYLINNKILVPLVKENKYYNILSEYLSNNSEDVSILHSGELSIAQEKYSEDKNKLLNKFIDPAIKIMGYSKN